MQVLAELMSYRRTNSTDEMDSPASLADSPLDFDLRSQSLVALELTMSPEAQRQLICTSPSIQKPLQASKPSSSRLAALVDQIPVPGEQDFPAKPPGGKSSSSRLKRPSRQSSTAAGQGSGGSVGAKPQGPAVSRAKSASTSRSLQRQSSAMAGMSHKHELNENELSASEEEACTPAQSTRGKRKLRVRDAANKKKNGEQCPAPPGPRKEGSEELAPAEEEWAPPSSVR